jgi:hypothetical protein
MKVQAPGSRPKARGLRLFWFPCLFFGGAIFVSILTIVHGIERNSAFMIAVGGIGTAGGLLLAGAILRAYVRQLVKRKP